MVWSWNETDSDIWRNGTFESKEEAIQDALENLDNIERSIHSTVIYVGECEDVPLRTDVDPDRIMEELDEKYSDDSGCDYYLYDGVTYEEREWLEDKLSKLINEFHKKIGLNTGWFKVITMEEVNLNDYKS